RRGHAIGAIPKFDEQVEDIVRLRPAEGTKASKLGAGVVGDENRVRPDRKRRWGSELATPQSPGLAAAPVLRHHANWVWPLARSTGIVGRGVATELELEVCDHDMGERQFQH